MTYEQCMAAGMTSHEAAAARGVGVRTVQLWAQRRNLRWAKPPRPKRAGVDTSWGRKLTAEEREVYTKYRRCDFDRAEALKLIGREDLI